MIELRANKHPWCNSVELIAISTEVRGRCSVGNPLTWRTIEEGEYFGEPTMVLSNESAQLLMDELWRVGLRPSEGSGSSGSLAATERHLKDMRDVAMALLRKDGASL